MLDFEKQRLLVIAPHPDDEVIGCGGLIKKIKDAGGKVYVLLLTVGDTADFSKKGGSRGNERVMEFEKVARFLKFDAWHLAFGGNNFHLQLDLLGQKKLMDTIERHSPVALEKIKPTIVAFPSPRSYNQDHRIAALATHAALRPASQKSKHFVETVLSYEEAADFWTQVRQQSPNIFVPLSEGDLDIKMSALGLYKSQMRPYPNLRSAKILETLAILRGAQIGTDYAEGFNLYRGRLKA